MSADNAATEGVRLIPLGGMNEQRLPEYAADDFAFLQGLTNNREGELVRLPGKTILQRIGRAPILGVSMFGDNIIVETNTQLIRFTNSEIFGGTETSPNPTPDSTQPRITSEEEELTMAQVILKYRLAGNTSASAISAATWTRVPFTNRDRDSNANCVLDGSGNFTLSAASYPRIVRVEGAVNYTKGATTPSAEAVGQLLLETNTGSLGAGTFVLSGMNAICDRTASTRNNAIMTIKGHFTLSGATTYRLCMRASESGSMGTPVNTGSTQEVYGMLELLIEDGITPAADGTVTPVTSITTESGIITAIS